MYRVPARCGVVFVEGELDTAGVMVGSDVCGGVLRCGVGGGGHDVAVMLLVPADVLNPRRPDGHFAGEAAAAREVGVAVVDHDALCGTDESVVARAVARVPSGGEAGGEAGGGGVVVYRFTPVSVWTVGDDRADFARACAELGSGPAVLRDYTKSMKHYWAEAAFIPRVDDVAAA